MERITEDCNRVCRLCLVRDVKMYSLLSGELSTVYHRLTGIMVVNDGWACWQCTGRLKSAATLRRRALLAHLYLIKSIPLSEVHEMGSIEDLKPMLEISNRLHVEDVSEQAEVVKSEPKVEVELKPEPETNPEADEDSQLQQETELEFDISEETNVEDVAESLVGDDGNPKDNKKRSTKDSEGYVAVEVSVTEAEQAADMSARALSANYRLSPYKCALCFRGFLNLPAFQNHRAKHDPRRGAWECEVCRLRYCSERRLRAHRLASHQRRFLCPICPHKANTKNQAREHRDWHEGVMYECKICGEKFRKPTSQLTHMRKHHASEHVCEYCGDCFLGPHGLNMHRLKTHNLVETAPAAAPPPPPPPAPAPPPALEQSDGGRKCKGPESERDGDKSDKSEGDGARWCDECGVQFKCSEAHERHLVTSSRHATAPAPPRPRKRRVARSVAEGEGMPCEQCGGMFTTRARLTTHLRSAHLGLKYERKVICEVCGKKCTSNASLTYHMRVHTGERPFGCVHCAKRFADRNQLRIHERVHTGERPYSCAHPGCGKRFRQKPALNRHLRVHTGAKPYECAHCGKCFSQSNSLKLHSRTVHLSLDAALHTPKPE